MLHTLKHEGYKLNFQIHILIVNEIADLLLY